LGGLRASSFHEPNEEEQAMTKLLISLLGAGVLATGGWAAASGFDDADPARSVSLPVATSTGDDTPTQKTTTTAATTPATTTAAVTTAATTTVEDDVENEVEDVSGPCDEAEHRTDPRCTGVAGARADDDDRSGSNSDDAREDDRSGSNSGSGSDDDGNDDRSGSNDDGDDDDSDSDHDNDNDD